jgi:hypothetical protein
MALDSAFDDGARDAGIERHPRHCGSGGDAGTARGGPVELRTRAECYEALRAADGGSAQTAENQQQEDPGTDHRPDPQTERSGWDAIDAENRPPEAIRVSPERASHILDGDEYGGGHRTGPASPARPNSRRAGTTRRSLLLPSTSRANRTGHLSTRTGTTAGFAAVPAMVSKSRLSSCLAEKSGQPGPKRAAPA